MLSGAVNTKYLEAHRSLERDYLCGVGFEHNFDASIDCYEAAAGQNIVLDGLRIGDRVLKSIRMDCAPMIARHWNESTRESRGLLAIMLPAICCARGLCIVKINFFLLTISDLC